MSQTPIEVVNSADFSAWLAKQTERDRAWLNTTGFKAAAGTHALLAANDGRLQRVVAGVDKPGLYSIASLASKLPAGRYELAADWSEPSTAQMALGFLLEGYRFDRYLEKKSESAELVLPADKQEQVQRLAAAQAMVRDLVNTPTEDLGPAHLAEFVHELARTHQATFSQIVGDELLAQNLPAIHAVGRAAADDRAPRLLRLDWGDSNNPKLVLVGKGVCFDTGGLNIKTGNYMVLMKKDMGGAAHALAVAELIMRAGLPVSLTVLIPAVENAIDGGAYRPGDIIPTRAGKTVEIGNTDAEGRVVLADALTVAGELSPELIIDFATLTGAARIAMGPDLPPLFATSDAVADGILQSGEAVTDPLWRLPLYAPYLEMMRSPIADLNNSASSPMGGCITAALFLQEFVADGIDWCHIDTYAWNRSSRPGRPKGGEAQSMRAVFQYLQQRFAS